MQNNILILGAGGVFGNLNAKHILETSNDKVFAVGRNPRLGPEFTLNVGLNNRNYEYHQIHMVFEIEKLKKFIVKNKINIIINYAALAYANSWYDAHLYFNTNSSFVAELVDFLSGVDFFDYFLQIGTSEVYGSTPEPACETIIAPTSPYAVSKLGADLHLQSMSKVRDFPCSIIRPSNCFGEGQYAYRIIPKAMLYFLNKKKFPLEGGGSAQKSFMHMQNLCSAVDLVLKYRPAGEIYNVGPEAAISMAEIIHRICYVMNVNFEEYVDVVEGRMFEDQIYWLNSDKAKADLGWSLTVDFDEGLQRVFQWVNENKGLLAKAPDSFELRA